MHPSNERLRRALLFMPGDNMKMIRKGAALHVDAVIMDLEDGVALSQKAAARQTVLRALQDNELDFGSTERLVRTNPVGTAAFAADIADTVAGMPHGYVLPKVEDVSHIADAAVVLAEQEVRLGVVPGTIHLVAIIETALGIVNLRDIASAAGRLVALAFGAEDYAGSVGAVRTVESTEVLFARSALVAHAKAFGLQALDTPYVDLHNADGLLADAKLAHQLGYDGKLAIHPRQLDAIVAAFAPTEAQIAAAKALIAAHDAHQAKGTGVFSYEGRMVDMPMIRAAERVLRLAGA